MTRTDAKTALRWTSDTGRLVALGGKAMYVIRWNAGKYILTATGHDTLPLLCLPYDGMPFDMVDQAKAHADSIERAGAEGEVSGT